MKNKKGQVTIFIILAIAIVAVIILIFVFRDKIITSQMPAELEPVYNFYLSCMQEEATTGAIILGQQGGYIETPEFSPGSEYMPFSSQLDFLGAGIPYWYYVSGNGIANEQVPSKDKMQSQLDNYVQEGLGLCNFAQFTEQGFEIILDEPSVKATIEKNKILINTEQKIIITFGNTTWTGTNHVTEIQSSLGKFYDLAEKIYQNQKETMFLENYGVDVLRLYAPVDGSEIGCNPKVWFIENIRENLTQALELNIPMTKLKGDYYSLSSPENKYFVKDIGENVNVDVNFMYSRDWPLKLEAWPSEDNILRADPVGLQEGMGMLGFCYTPYHFVYDLAYPVMIQLYSGNELFQFPVVISIDKNQPRQAADVEGLPDVVPELCEKKNTELRVYTYDVALDPVNSTIRFKCFDTVCNIGQTEIQGLDAVLTANFPQCVNGYILASAEGYETKKYLISSVQEGDAIIILDKKYKLDLEVRKDNALAENEYAVITFTKDGKSQTVSYPEQKQVELTSGQYEIKSYVYSNANILLKGSSSQKCVDAPRTGLLGILGSTEKKCFDLVIPDQTVEFAVSGGGSQEYYIGQSELEDSKKVIINAENFGNPSTLEGLQTNYNNVEVSGLNIIFE